MENHLISTDKCYCCKCIVYDILPPKIVQVYCTSDLRRKQWGKYDNGDINIKKEHGIKLKKRFDLNKKFLEAIDDGKKMAKNRFPLN